MYYSYNDMYQYSYVLCMTQIQRFINTHINVCIHKQNYSYKGNYVFFSDKSPLLLVVNKKSSETLSAF